jgi:hypothetical protein
MVVEIKTEAERTASYYRATDTCDWTETLKFPGHYGRVVKATDSNFSIICFPMGAQVQILLVSTFLTFS